MNAAAMQPQQHQLLPRLAESRALTDDLFRRVAPQALYDRPIAERHRIVFYLGHLEAFDRNLIAGQALGADSAHPEFDRLFAFGIDPVGGGFPTDQPADWPALAEVNAYNQGAREELNRILADGVAAAWQYPRDTVLNVAIEHRLMHAETLAYMLHQLPLERKVAPPQHRPPVSSPCGSHSTARMIDIPAGNVTLGIPQGRGVFGWDNEFDVHSVQVPAFSMDASKVTNRDFLGFMAEGGYEDRRFWDEAGWAWTKAQNIQHPRFWFER